MPATSLRWSVVVPVKRPDVAKSRLADVARGQRAALARALAADTITATIACPAVAEVVVVTDDAEAAVEAEATGAVVVPDEPGAGLNPALVHGALVARKRRLDAPVAAVSADLAALRPAELAAVLDAAGHVEQSFVADAAGTGSTVYTAGPGVRFSPLFGERSRAAHRAAGAVEIDLAGIPSVRRDIDTAIDLWDAVRLGVGPRTAAVARALRH